MLAQLIQALYNIVDSLFVGKYSETGLTALSIIYPLQLLMIALAVGTGVGINTDMAYYFGIRQEKKAEEVAGIGTPLAVFLWIVFAVVCYLFMPFYARISTNSEEIIRDVVVYGRIVCVVSIGLFTEGVWSKILQARGDMKTPMVAQIAGAITNIILDPILIFGMFGIHKFGIAGAAIATVIGQIVAALVVMRKAFVRSPEKSCYLPHIKRIYQLGIPNILMQSAYTFYIFGLNMILAGFSDQAVTALGLYYKWQSFFFIPLGALQTCIVPVISFNYAAKDQERCKAVLKESLIAGMALMFLGTLCFEFLPVFERCTGDCNRNERISLYWSCIYPDGHFTDLSGVFSGDRQCCEKFDPYRCEDNGFVCPAWISVFQVWTAVFLADLSGDGSAHNTGRI